MGTIKIFVEYQRKPGKEKLKNVISWRYLRIFEDYETAKRALGRFK